ncbi:MAG: SIMPL domain-containing protein [Steroidobacteraceae bacterium]|nr:SIMPL domain-containing protein [Steroidobacteraceae bacterium]
MWIRLARAPLALAVVLLPVALAFADEARPRTVSVTGQGEVTAEPDLAHVVLGVEARRPALAEARTEVAAAVERLLALTKSLGIDPRLVNATRMQVQPEYRWNEKDRQRVLLGYFVSRQVQVELRNLEQLGTLLERAVDAGANQVSDPVLDSTRRKDLERDAMTRAVQDARQNAETLARAAGVKLGPVRVLSAAPVGPVMPRYRMAMAMAEASMPPEETFQPGDMKFSASVSAEYDLTVGQ